MGGIQLHYVQPGACACPHTLSLVTASQEGIEGWRGRQCEAPGPGP